MRHLCCRTWPGHKTSSNKSIQAVQTGDFTGFEFVTLWPTTYELDGLRQYRGTIEITDHSAPKTGNGQYVRTLRRRPKRDDDVQGNIRRRPKPYGVGSWAIP